MSAFIQYIQESLIELRQVRWPTRSQAIRLSVIVVGFTIGTALVFGVVDYLLSQVLQMLLSFTN